MLKVFWRFFSEEAKVFSKDEADFYDWLDKPLPGIEEDDLEQRRTTWQSFMDEIF